MITPIIKVSKGKTIKSFYNLTDYEKWKKKTKDYKKWNAKYYKGLGTSTAIEAREYFKNMKKNDYEWTDKSDDKMNLAFKKDQSDLRKIGYINMIKTILSMDPKIIFLLKSLLIMN